MKSAFKRVLLPVIAIFTIVSAASAQDTPPSADKVLKDAFAKAAKEKKKVFLMFHASWCGWCHKMDEAMNDSSCKQFFTDNYVISHLVVKESPKNKHLENPGADSLLAKYHGDKAGIPFWLVFDKNGKLMGDSQIRQEGVSLDAAGKNVGCPAQPEEIAHFEKVLKNTSSLNEGQLAIIRKRFEGIRH